MLQRNARHHSVVLPTTVPPVEVHSGETIDFPDLIAGFIPVNDNTPLAGTPSDLDFFEGGVIDPGTGEADGPTDVDTLPELGDVVS